MTSVRHKERLWLSLRFPALAAQALGFNEGLFNERPLENRGDDQTPVIITEHQRVFYANAKARALGVSFDMNITTAKVLSDAEVCERNAQLEQQVLQQLAAYLYQFTPYIENHTNRHEGGVLLEISRSLKLFDGVIPLSEKIFACLNTTPYHYQYGLAHTAKGAWLLSYQSHPIDGNENKALFIQRLANVPVQQLGEYEQAVAALEKSGFQTLGDIVKQIETTSISSIKKRFGKEFTEDFCDIFAIEQNFQQKNLFSKPTNTFQPQDFFLDCLEFDYPVCQMEQLKPAMELLLKNLQVYLRQRQWQCQHIQWQLFDIQRHSESLDIHCDHPQSQWSLLYELSCIRLENHALPFAVDSIELNCRQTSAIQNRDQHLNFQGKTNRLSQQQDLSLTTAKLKTRLGDNAVFKMSYRDSHIPEHSNIAIALSEPSHQQLPDLHTIALRPSWLFDSPQRIQQRAEGLYWKGYLQLLTGPERIEGEWWENRKARDYFLAQRQDFLRLWIFQDLQEGNWYVQGIFA